jgi:hypothetical protein
MNPSSGSRERAKNEFVGRELELGGNFLVYAKGEKPVHGVPVVRNC